MKVCRVGADDDRVRVAGDVDVAGGVVGEREGLGGTAAAVNVVAAESVT